MKRFLSLIVLLVIATLAAFAQKVDYTTYIVLGKQGNVAIVVKNNDYRMVVGALDSPKTVFLLGNYQDNAERQIDNILKKADQNHKYKEDCLLLFGGVPISVIPKGQGDHLRFTFQRSDNKVKFVMTKEDLLALKQCFRR